MLTDRLQTFGRQVMDGTGNFTLAQEMPAAAG